MAEQAGTIKVVQCWDDGVTNDIRLIEILRRYNARSSFNLNYKLHDGSGSNSWRFRDKDVVKIPTSDLRAVYDGFLVANHTATHPDLTKLSVADATREIHEGKDLLEQHFGYEVKGFAYPGGHYNPVVEDLIREAGHVYARTVVEVDDAYPTDNPMAFHSNCHFKSHDFWKRFDHVAATGSVFYFWGHSYEIVTESEWNEFEEKIKGLSENPRVQWVDLPSLFV